MRALLTVAVVVALSASTLSVQQREPILERSFDDLLTVAGLQHLNTDDRDKVERLLLGLNQATTAESREKATAFDSVVGYLESQGFAPELIMSSMRDGQPILILGRIVRVFTADIPASLRSRDWRNGVYFVRWNDDRASEIIIDGEVHDFRQSHWDLF